MNVYDLIFMACLSLHQGTVCKQEMLKCVLDIRNTHLKTFIASDTKKMDPDQFLNAQPQADWQTWVLDCMDKQSGKVSAPIPINTPVKK